MPKKTLVLFVSLAFAAGCARGVIVVKNDDFKKSTIVRMDLDHTAYTDARHLNYLSYGCTYEREIAGGRKLTALYHVRLMTSVLSKDLKGEAFVKIDDAVRRVSVADVASDRREEVRREVVMRASDKSGKAEKTGDTVTVNENKIMTATLSFTPEIEKLILKAQTLQYRLYAQTDAITLTVSARDLERVKAFLLAPEERHTTEDKNTK